MLFFHRALPFLAVSPPSRSGLLEKTKSSCFYPFSGPLNDWFFHTEPFLSLAVSCRFWVEDLSAPTKNRVNSKITYLFLTSLSVTSRQLPSKKNKNFKNFKNPYSDCVLPPFYRLKPFESDGTMCGVNGRDTETQPPQGFIPQKPQSLSGRRKKKKIKKT